jgi:hypothetical protein
MRYVLSGRTPKGSRILLIESGSRAMAEGVLPVLAGSWAQQYEMDLVTCYGGLPRGFPEGGNVYRTGDYGSPGRRKELLRELRSRDYAFAGIICSAEPVMTWWKWYLAAQLPAKVFIVNENCDYFWINRENASTLREFALVRMGMEGGGALRVIARLIAFPFAILYLLLYACVAHTRRALRTTFRLNS